MASIPTLQLDVAHQSRRAPPAVYTVSSQLYPDGTVQTTSQVTLGQFPNFINGQDVQLFVQAHGAVHFQNVQRHGSSRQQAATRDRSPERQSDSRSRSPVPRRSRVRLTPGPHSQHDEEDGWGDWTQQGHRPRRQQDDRRRPQSPTAHPGSALSNNKSDNQSHAVGLIPLQARAPSTSLGSHVFVLRAGYEVEEVAIRINDVQYYTLPSIALVYPEPAIKWKQHGRRSAGVSCRIGPA